MLQVHSSKDGYCPYRDGLGIDTSRTVTWYILLGVEHDSDAPAIKKAYTDTCRLIKYYQTQSSHQAWSEMHSLVDEAYRTLSNHHKRAEYDYDNQKRMRPRTDSTESENSRAIHDVRESRTVPRLAAKAAVSTESKAETGRGDFCRYERIRKENADDHNTYSHIVTDYRIGRTVIIRGPKKKYKNSPEDSHDFINRYRRIANITHPNLMIVYEINPRDAYVVLEYLGTPLNVAIDEKLTQNNGRCKEDFVRSILTQVLAVLVPIHGHGLVVGNLRMQSFAFNEAGVLKLQTPPIDPGETLCLDAGDETIAPEQLRPEHFGPGGPKSDLYRLGHICLAMLLGQTVTEVVPNLPNRLSTRPDIEACRQWHAAENETIKDIERLCGISGTLAEVLQDFIEKAPADRRLSAADALNRLQSAPLAVTRDTATPAPVSTALSPTRIANLFKSKAATILLAIAAVPLLIIPSGTDRSAATETEGYDADSEEQSAASLIDEPADVAANIDTQSDSEPVYAPTEIVSVSRATPEKIGIPASVLMNEKKLPASDIRDLTPSQTVLPLPTRRNTPDAQNSAAGLGNEPETAATFSIVGLRAADTSRIRELVKQLRAAAATATRLTLLDEATRLAPKDPRWPFLRAAALGFRGNADTFLAQSLELSSLEFMLPVQIRVASLISASDREPEAAFSELLRFATRLRKEENPVRQLTGWRWIGTTLGHLEATTLDSTSHASLMLEHTVALIIKRAGEYAEEVRAAMTAAAESNQQSHSQSLHLAPEIAYEMALDTLPE